MEVNFNNCDGALWHIEKSETSIEIDSTLYKYQDKTIAPDDLGYKYHILTYKEDDHSSAEVLCAYIGDVRYFIDNHAKAGYNGLMVKHKSIPKKTIKEMFGKVLSNWQFPSKAINAIVRQV